MANVKGYVVGVDERPEKEAFQADIIQLRGTVHGPKGRGYLNYLTLGGGTPGQAWNMARVQERPGVPVWIGYEKDEVVILSLDKSRMEPNGAQGYRSPLFSQHAPDHRWSSGDPLYVDSRQIEDLMVRPAGLLKVRVNPGWYGSGTGYAYYAGQASYDLAAYQPAAGTKRGVGLYLDSDGALQAVAGTVVARTAVLPEPDWPAGVFRLAVVIIYGDKNFVDFEYIKQRKALYSNPVAKATGLYTPGGTLAWEVEADGDLTNPGGGYLDVGAVSGLYPCEGRLTLTSGTAVTTGNVTAATTIYFTPFNGNRLALYDGSKWLNYTFTERSLSLSGLAADTNYDVFIYDNAGTLTLEAVAWSSGSARATALTTQDGRVVKSGDATRLYLGTFRTTSTTGQTEDSQTARYCWNYYNRALKDATVANNTSHTYDSATVRAFNAGAMFVSGLAYVVGIVQEVITASLNGQITRLNTDSAAALGIGIASNAHAISSLVGGNFNGAIRANLALLPITPAQGYNELWITESGGNTAGDPTFASGRLLVTLKC